MSYAIAVIGSGMAGLAAARGCRLNGHAVTLFEAQDSHGMDAHSMDVDGGIVDVPLRVMSSASWPNMLALAKEVGVETFDVKVDISCSWLDQETWLRSGHLPVLDWPFLGSWRYLNKRALIIAQGFWQLVRVKQTLQRTRSRATLDQVLEEYPFDPVFWRGLVLPILTTICTCDEEHLLAWPAIQLLEMLDSIARSSSLHRLKGGTSALVNRLAEDLPLYAGSPVARVEEQSGGEAMEVYNERGQGGVFDRVIVATQANQLGFLEDDHFAQERQILGNIHFDSGALWVHRDQRFMPGNRRDWTALNFQMDKQLQKPMFTVWMNEVEPTLKGKAPLFQTWNPLFEPDSGQVLARVPLQRAVVHSGTRRVHEHLEQWHSEPGRKVFFCGSWAHEGVPLLESAVRSAKAVVGAIESGRGHRLAS